MAESPDADSSDASRPPDATRARLLQATTEVFREKGWGGTRVQEIARRAGFTTGAIYANFANKEALLTEALLLAAMAELDAATTAPADPTQPADTLADVTRRLLSEPGNDGHLFLVHAIAIAAGNAEATATLRPHLDSVLRGTRALFRSAQEQGAVDPSLSADALAHFGAAVAYGAFVLKALGVEPPEPAAVDAVVARLVGGFAPVDGHAG